MTAAIVAAASTSMMWASGAGVVSGAVTTVATNALQIHQGQLQLDLKRADMEASIPNKVSIPEVHPPR